jgi:hypothetical protein
VPTDIQPECLLTIALHQMAMVQKLVQPHATLANFERVVQYTYAPPADGWSVGGRQRLVEQFLLQAELRGLEYEVKSLVQVLHAALWLLQATDQVVGRLLMQPYLPYHACKAVHGSQSNASHLAPTGLKT